MLLGTRSLMSVKYIQFKYNVLYELIYTCMLRTKCLSDVCVHIWISTYLLFQFFCNPILKSCIFCLLYRYLHRKRSIFWTYKNCDILNIFPRTGGGQNHCCHYLAFDVKPKNPFKKTIIINGNKNIKSSESLQVN